MNGGLNGVIKDVDQSTPGTVTIPAMCNAAGTAWMYNGNVLMQLECSSDRRMLGDQDRLVEENSA